MLFCCVLLRTNGENCFPFKIMWHVYSIASNIPLDPLPWLQLHRTRSDHQEQWAKSKEKRALRSSRKYVSWKETRARLRGARNHEKNELKNFYSLPLFFIFRWTVLTFWPLPRWWSHKARACTISSFRKEHFVRLLCAGYSWVTFITILK